MAALAAVLLALIFFNAADICSAVGLEPAQAHPCCPVSDRQAPEHCAKLGCFMAAPALKTKAPSVGHPAWIATPHAAPLVGPYVTETAVARSSRVAFDRCVSLHQLLI